MDLHPEIQADRKFVEEAALLHDIGVYKTYAPEIACFGSLPYICHGYLGADLLREEGYGRHALVCERHTGAGISLRDIVDKELPLPRRDMLPVSIEEQLICFADKFFSKTELLKERSVAEARHKLERFGAEGWNVSILVQSFQSAGFTYFCPFDPWGSMMDVQPDYKLNTLKQLKNPVRQFNAVRLKSRFFGGFFGSLSGCTLAILLLFSVPFVQNARGQSRVGETLTRDSVAATYSEETSLSDSLDRSALETPTGVSETVLSGENDTLPALSSDSLQVVPDSLANEEEKAGVGLEHQRRSRIPGRRLLIFRSRRNGALVQAGADCLRRPQSRSRLYSNEHGQQLDLCQRNRRFNRNRNRKSGFQRYQRRVHFQKPQIQFQHPAGHYKPGGYPAGRRLRKRPD